jgi:uncharacterized protein YndB with AHSA1/START domain
MTGTYTTTVEINAHPDVVYRHFVEPARLVRWMGDHAKLHAVAEGTFSVDINGVLIRGHFVALEPGRRIEIAWGELGNPMMPPGSTRLVVQFEPTREGTRLTLTHSGLAATEAAKHSIGWPHFLHRLCDCAEGRDPGPDPWKTQSP